MTFSDRAADHKASTAASSKQDPSLSLSDHALNERSLCELEQLQQAVADLYHQTLARDHTQDQWLERAITASSIKECLPPEVLPDLEEAARCSGTVLPEGIEAIEWYTNYLEDLASNQEYPSPELQEETESALDMAQRLQHWLEVHGGLEAYKEYARNELADREALEHSYSKLAASFGEASQLLHDVRQNLKLNDAIQQGEPQFGTLMAYQYMAQHLPSEALEQLIEAISDDQISAREAFMNLAGTYYYSLQSPQRIGYASAVIAPPAEHDSNGQPQLAALIVERNRLADSSHLITAVDCPPEIQLKFAELLEHTGDPLSLEDLQDMAQAAASAKHRFVFDFISASGDIQQSGQIREDLRQGKVTLSAAFRFFAWHAAAPLRNKDRPIMAATLICLTSSRDGASAEPSDLLAQARQLLEPSKLSD